MGKIIGTGVAVLLGLFALAWAVQGNNFFMYKVFAPQYADTQRQVFENSAPFTQGMADDLRRQQEEYLHDDADHKAALGALIVHQYASYDENKLPPDLRDFYEQVKKDQGL